MIVQQIMGRAMASGTIAVTGTPKVVPMGGMPLPATVTLNTTYASKLIEISTDGGILYFTPTYATSDANQLVVTVTAPISHVRLTGTAGDLWSVR